MNELKLNEWEIKAKNEGTGTPLEMTLEELGEYFERLGEGVVVSVGLADAEEHVDGE